jgi:hypothetical protein
MPWGIFLLWDEQNKSSLISAMMRVDEINQRLIPFVMGKFEVKW